MLTISSDITNVHQDAGKVPEIGLLKLQTDVLVSKRRFELSTESFDSVSTSSGCEFASYPQENAQTEPQDEIRACQNSAKSKLRKRKPHSLVAVSPRHRIHVHKWNTENLDICKDSRISHQQEEVTSSDFKEGVAVAFHHAPHVMGVLGVAKVGVGVAVVAGGHILAGIGLVAYGAVALAGAGAWISKQNSTPKCDGLDDDNGFCTGSDLSIRITDQNQP